MIDDPNVLDGATRRLRAEGRIGDALSIYFFLAYDLECGRVADDIGACYDRGGDLAAARYWYGRATEEDPEYWGKPFNRRIPRPLARRRALVGQIDLVGLIKEADRRGPTSGRVIEGHDAKALRRAADRLAGAGHYREALRLYYLLADGEADLIGTGLASAIAEALERLEDWAPAKYWYEAAGRVNEAEALAAKAGFDHLITEEDHARARKPRPRGLMARLRRWLAERRPPNPPAPPSPAPD